MLFLGLIFVNAFYKIIVYSDLQNKIIDKKMMHKILHGTIVVKDNNILNLCKMIRVI